MSEQNTPLVCGGIYRTKEKPGHATYTAMLVSVVEPTGMTKPCGLLQVVGYAAEKVTEGSDRLNEFDLISMPVFVSGKRAKRKSYTRKKDSVSK